MLDLLKKIGIPATVAAVIASLVTMVPLLFKLDERYAKEEDLTAQTARTEKVINELTVEISRLAGTQQVMVASWLLNHGLFRPLKLRNRRQTSTICHLRMLAGRLQLPQLQHLQCWLRSLAWTRSHELFVINKRA